MIQYKDNTKQFNAAFKRQERAVRRGLRQGGAISGNDLVKSLKKDMKQPKSGRTYKTSIGMSGNLLQNVRTYKASSESQTPAVVTGEFRRSLGYEVQGSSRLVFGSGMDGLAKYAKFLEKGTKNMKARKPLQRAAKKMQRKVNDNINRSVVIELRKIGVDIK